MINSVGSFEYKQKDPFVGFSNQTNYWLGVQNNDKNKLGALPVLNDIKIMTPEEARKTKNTKIIGISIATATILTAGGILFFLKGGPKGVLKYFEKFRDFLESKVQKAKLEENSNTKLNKAYEFLARKMDFFAKRFESINNFTTIKDFAFKKLMYKNKKSAKIHASITKRFEKIGRRSVINAYEEASDRFAHIGQLHLKLERKLSVKDLDQVINIDGESKTLRQWLQDVRKLNNKYEQNFIDYFSENNLTNRYRAIKSSVQNMERDFDKKGAGWFLSGETLEEFVADSKIVGDKLKLQNQVKSMRRKLSYSLEDLSNDAEERIIRMTKLVNYDDIEKIKVLRNIRENFKNIAKAKTVEEKGKLEKKLLEDIMIFRKEIAKSGSDESNSLLLREIKELENSYINFKNGNMENILNIYKHLLSPKDFADVEHVYKGSIVSLDKAIKLETEDFFSKVRDLVLGSAPTDVLSILGAFGTLCYYLAKSDDNKERTSIALKYGLPALAAVGTSLFCSARLFAGSKSLFFGAISAFLVGKIGDISNDLFMHHYEKKSAS